MGENFEWGSTGSTPRGDVPNWTMAPPPAGPPPVPADSGPSKPRRQGRTIRTAAIATVTAGALAIVGVSVASAQSSGSTTTTPSTAVPGAAPSTPPPGTPKAGLGPRGGPGFRGPGGLGGGGSIHGEYVRPDGNGGYQTVDTQIGVVVGTPGPSAALIEVKSADGFDKKYKVTTNTVVNSGRDGIGSVKGGDTVRIEAFVTGTPPAAEAASIVDTTTLGAIQGHWKPQRPATTPSTTTP